MSIKSTYLTQIYGEKKCVSELKGLKTAKVQGAVFQKIDLKQNDITRAKMKETSDKGRKMRYRRESIIIEGIIREGETL